MRRYGIPLLLLLSLLFSFASQANEHAQSSQPIEKAKILRVGVPPGEPFVMMVNNEYQGIAVDIWKLIAKNLDLAYEFVPMSEHIDQDIHALANGEIDVLIGAIIPITEKMKLVDFMKPYYLNQIRLVVPVKKVRFSHALLDVLNSPMSLFMLTLILVFIIYIHVFWYYERNSNYMGIKPTYREGIRSAFWINTLDIGFDEIPTHPMTRRTRFLWFFIAFPLFLSTLSAVITSSLTVSLSNTYASYDKLSDFSDKTITAVIDTTPYDLAIAAGLRVVPAQNRDDAIERLLKGEVAGYADYYAIADYYLQKHHLTDKLTLSNAIIAQNTFAIALPINSPLRHSLNVQLDIVQEAGQVKTICNNLLGEQVAKNCEI